MGWVVNDAPRTFYLWESDLVSIVQEVGWALGPVWAGADNSPQPEFEPRTVRLVASRYADCDIPAVKCGECRWYYLKPKSIKFKAEEVEFQGDYCDYSLIVSFS